MKAWRFTGTHQPLVLEEVEVPRPGPGEVVIEVLAAGLCHSDVGILNDESWTELLPVVPITLGHEIAGVVCEVGEGVESVSIGDRVAVCPTGPSGSTPSGQRDGGFAELHLVPAVDLVRVPHGMSLELAAMATDAGMTAHRAVVVSGELRSGEVVGIVGLGGLGQIGAQLASHLGAEVHVADPNRSTWPIATRAGAATVVGDVMDWEEFKFDLIVDFAGFGTTTSNSLRALRPRGRLVVVGMGSSRATVDTFMLITRQATIRGSNGGSIEDVEAVVGLLARGILTPEMRTIDFADIPEAIDELARGGSVGRTVATRKPNSVREG